MYVVGRTAGFGRSNRQIKTLTAAASNAGRPILAGVQVFESWFREPSSKTGVIDAANPGYRQGGILGVIVGWERGKKEVKVLTPWPTWGDHGVTGDVRRRVVRVVVVVR